MNWLTTIWISGRVAKRYGLKAAAVAGWIFAQCQAQVPQDECKRTGYGRVYRKCVRVRVSCVELGRLLHLSRHTIEAIVHRLAADGIIDVWIPRGEERTRAYSIGSAGFTLLGRWTGEWYVAGEEVLSCWGLDTRVASVVGVNAAIVFQYLWHWSRNYRYGSHYSKCGRTWLPYTAAELARWIVFMSDDVIADALHVLVEEGLLEKKRDGKVCKWSIGGAGYALMGETPTRSEVAHKDVRHPLSQTQQALHEAQEGIAAAYSGASFGCSPKRMRRPFAKQNSIIHKVVEYGTPCGMSHDLWQRITQT